MRKIRFQREGFGVIKNGYNSGQNQNTFEYLGLGMLRLY